jgi:outer membrane protein, multidrug efflux system
MMECAVDRLAQTAFVIVLLAAAGCTVGPDYRLPKQADFNAPTAQGEFVGARQNPAVQAGTPPAEWWRLYRSPDLDSLVTAALSENTDLRVADANLERSHALVELARSEGQPNAGIEAGYDRTLLSAEDYLSTADLPPFNIYDLSLSASYELDLFGRIRRGIEAAKANDEAVRAARDWVRVTVAAQVTGAYLEVCTTGDELAVATRSVDLQRQSLAFTSRLKELGRGTSLDVTRSQALVDQIESSVPSIEARRRNALFRLATLTGRPPEEFDSRLTRCVSAPPLAEPIRVGDGAALLRRRPDVRAAERELAAATAEIGVATAELYPRVVLHASLGSAGIVPDFLTHKTDGWGIGPLISWQLNRSGPRARLAVATAAQKAQLARFDGVVLGALREVETTLNVYSRDLQRESSLKKARDEAAQGVADARLLQADGRTGALSTLDAERTLAGADAASAAIRARIAQDQVALFLALGGGWQTSTQPTPRQWRVSRATPGLSSPTATVHCGASS